MGRRSLDHGRLLLRWSRFHRGHRRRRFAVKPPAEPRRRPSMASLRCRWRRLLLLLGLEVQSGNVAGGLVTEPSNDPRWRLQPRRTTEHGPNLRREEKHVAAEDAQQMRPRGGYRLLLQVGRKHQSSAQTNREREREGGLGRRSRTDRQSMAIIQKGSCHDVIINPNWNGLRIHTER